MKKEKQLENSLRLCVFVIGIFSLCILLLTFKLKVNASSTSNTIIPYNVADMQSYNLIMLDYLDVALDKYFEVTNYSEDVPLLVWTNDGFFRNSFYEYYIMREPQLRSGYTYPDDYDFSSNKIYFVSSYQITRIVVRTDNFPPEVQLNQGIYATLCGNSQSVTTSIGSFLPLYPFYYNGEPLVDSTYNTEVLIYRVASGPDVFQSGHAIEPNFDSDTIIDSGLHPNILPSTPNYTTYNITTYQAPTIDTSSVENLLKSIWDVISYTGQYLISNIGGFINNIWNNISLAFGYIGDLLSYLFNRVLLTIKQSVNNLFENFRDLFEPVLNSFANMINIFNTLYNLGLKDDVFDLPTLFGALFVPNQSDLALLVDTFVEFDYLQTASVSIKSLINGIFDVLNDDAVYSIHLQGFTFHGVSVPEQEISFDWYLPYKATGDIFISAFLIVGYLYWLWTRISGLFHGVVPDSQGASNITVSDHSKEFFGFPY